ncbi:MAG: magnesium protoporphyrin IX methyltransferase [Limibacillus sp.]|jgi:magnesium-protoporphyrin O-methyltransferase
MQSASYQTRRQELETYFDRTAAEAWARLTSSAPVSGIRATVRAGRDEMRATLLSWLPDDMKGLRLLDAGCGTGALAMEAAARGAEVVAVDISPTLVGLARERAAERLPGAKITFLAGDMLNPELGHFDHVVAMDSLIHYRAADMTGMLARLAERTRGSLIFTFAPRTPALTVMHTVGRAFPRGNRAPAIEPIAETKLRGLIEASPDLAGWRCARNHRITTGFYMSHAEELLPR